jgi:CO/xanthine dehydrogenase Mo-binding subunit
MLQAAADSPLWAESGPDVATGMALNWQGTGLGTLPDDRATGTLRLAADGKIEVLCGLDEMGQGLLSGLQAVVADRLGCARSDVRPIVGDTSATPDSGSTTASRGGYVVWRLADLAAPGFARDVLAAGCRRLSLPEGALRLCPGGLAVVGSNSSAPNLTFADLAQTDRPETSASFDFPKAAYIGGNARFIFESGATLARVQLDRATGQVRVLDLHLHTAAGPVIDLASYLGQIEGAAVQGLGFTLTEDVLYLGGLPVTANLDTYLMPTIQDRPLRLAVTADETLDPGDPYGPRGVGELGIGAVTPAIANAVAALTGRWPQTAPFAPEEML